MAYQNPENGRIYLNMKTAPICAIYNSINSCFDCKIFQIAQKHHVDGGRGMPCQATCELYGDEVAEAYGYKKIEYNEHKSNLEMQPNSTNEFTHTMVLQCIRDRVNLNGNPVNYRVGDQIGDTIIIDLDTLYFDGDGTPYAYGKDPKNMNRYPVNYRLDRFMTITE